MIYRLNSIDSIECAYIAFIYKIPAISGAQTYRQTLPLKQLCVALIYRIYVSTARISYIKHVGAHNHHGNCAIPS